MLSPQKLLERLGAVAVRAGVFEEFANINRERDLWALKRP